MEWRRLGFSRDSQFHLIIARQGERSAGAFAGIKSARGFDWIIIMKVPGETVHPFHGRNGSRGLDLVGPFGWLIVLFLFLARKMPDHLSLGVEDIEDYFILRGGFQVVIDDSASGRVVADGLSFIDVGRVMQAQRGLRLVKQRVHLRRLR